MFPTLTLQIERWKFNKEFEVYVSNMGRFRNKHKKDLKLKTNNNGYLHVVVGGNKVRLAHRLVMLTWCPIPNPQDMTVDHKNHNKRDNRLSNLEWMSREENNKLAVQDEVKQKDGLIEKIPSLDRSKIYCEFGSIDELVVFICNINENKFARKMVKKQILKSMGECSSLRAFGLNLRRAV